MEANPGLSAENFRIGQVILIPQRGERTGRYRPKTD